MNVRLCYASQRNEKNEDLLQDLRDILTEARDFNDLNGICGVLYYADNAFFQCLEGEQEVVERLFEKFKKIKGIIILNGYAHTPLMNTLFSVGQ